MIPIEVASVFLLASAALALAPGPDNIFVLTQSALSGRAAGVLVTLGLCTGLLVHTGAVALGVAAIVQTSAFAFNAIKMAGAAYLSYLAWRAWRASAAAIGTGRNVPTGARALYLRGVVMNVTNPKVATFFLAFLSQFADPARGSLVPQLLALGALFIVATLIVFGSIAWTAGLLGDWLQRSVRAQQVMNRIAAAVFVALAIRLLLSTR